MGESPVCDVELSIEKIAAGVICSGEFIEGSVDCISGVGLSAGSAEVEIGEFKAQAKLKSLQSQGLQAVAEDKQRNSRCQFRRPRLFASRHGFGASTGHNGFLIF